MMELRNYTQNAQKQLKQASQCAGGGILGAEGNQSNASQYVLSLAKEMAERASELDQFANMKLLAVMRCEPESESMDKAEVRDIPPYFASLREYLFSIDRSLRSIARAIELTEL